MQPQKINSDAVVTDQNKDRIHWEEKLRAAHRLADDYKKMCEFRAQQLLESEKRLDFLLALQEHKKPIVIKPRKDSASESIAFAIASDWHVEEVVRPETVNGLNTFNLDVADSRINRFFKSILKLVQIQRHGTQIDTLVLALLGDMITGYIHEELMEGNSLSPTEATNWVMERIIAGINMLKAYGNFKKIYIPCCYGNHGRTTIKRRVSTGAKNSYEWFMYTVMAKIFKAAGDDTVEFNIAQGAHKWVDAYGYQIRMSHGDDLKFQGGVGGITIPVNKAIAAWNQSKVAYLDIFGHWHQYLPGSLFMANGSLIGYSAYALSIKAAFEKPRQTFFLIEKDKGRTVTCPIALE